MCVLTSYLFIGCFPRERCVILTRWTTFFVWETYLISLYKMQQESFPCFKKCVCIIHNGTISILMSHCINNIWQTGYRTIGGMPLDTCSIKMCMESVTSRTIVCIEMRILDEVYLWVKQISIHLKENCRMKH